MKSYEVIKDSRDFKKGEIVYQPIKHDYGLASDDTRITGIEHISVTRMKNGDYPVHTIERNHLKEL